MNEHSFKRPGEHGVMGIVLVHFSLSAMDDRYLVRITFTPFLKSTVAHRGSTALWLHLLGSVVPDVADLLRLMLLFTHLLGQYRKHTPGWETLHLFWSHFNNWLILKNGKGKCTRIYTLGCFWPLLCNSKMLKRQMSSNKLSNLIWDIMKMECSMVTEH